jgi:hypothetical protein
VRNAALLLDQVRHPPSAHAWLAVGASPGTRGPYAVRKPKQYAVSRPGGLVPLDVRPLPGVVFKQFSMCSHAET